MTICSKLPVADAFRAEYLEYHGLLPLDLADGVLRVAVSGNPDSHALDDLARTYAARLEPVEVAREELQAAIQRQFAPAESVVELVRDLASGNAAVQDGDDGLTDARAQANQAPVVRFVNLLLREAHEAAASDIHLDAARDGLRVRLRIDGTLSELPAPPRSLQAPVLSRLKLLAELDIAERRRPQDGRIRVRLDNRELDLRISTVPSLHGESMVLRLLDRGGRPVSLDELGMEAVLAERLKRLAARPHGILLATGPTGSGKTTTLYAALALRNASAEKVITIEDPVEYHLPGVTQVPVHERTGMTFAAALRSILRQDPDVLMVGEMRDPETARIAIQAAMTGHLVFSTLHTNDAASALTRLVDLQLEPYMVAAAVEGILAQRLVRRICQECREAYEPSPELVALVSTGEQDAECTMQRGAGCPACRFTGFRGRLGVYELLELTEELRELLGKGSSLQGLRRAARDAGMRSLREDGWHKARSGLTTVEEVVRVIQA